MDSDCHEAILPWPVSVNALYRARGRRVYVSAKGKAFKQACGIIFAGTKMAVSYTHLTLPTIYSV